ncbi:TetR/AcrR family transcriptional regulator [Natronoglycomyces albus]|uniref:Helix-turn-helix transcriptional regulator n=1 Tax=Natronoglycomyces albus TaxID=2811108 RepID=A0A895XR38_9ACTN|nr:TetR/AcrR family transcriptional regulator [Natronoglycomyces albus]QSB05026.1 helix-turn-helix transcriptional regulator [Natronoglycomyces albus]
MQDRPRLRADARRNRDRILACAHTVFSEQGSDVALEDVAKEAGVGIGTLYRHFPNRAALLEGLLHQRLSQLDTFANQLLAEEKSPGESLIAWHLRVLEHLSTYRGLAASLTGPGTTPSPLHVACHTAQQSGAALLAKAQAAKQARPDVTAAELFLLTAGAAWAAEQGLDDSVTGEQLLRLAFRGVLH